MKRPWLRFRPRFCLPLGLLVLPPLFWTLVIAVLPTGWARARVVARMEEATGRPVALKKLRVGWLGGLHLGGVSVDAPGAGSDPWLSIGDAAIDVSLAQLLFGQVDPTDLRIDGLTLRVLRRGDGSFELADSTPATAPASAPRPASDAGGGSSGPSALRFQVVNGRITVVDQATGTKVNLTGVEGRGTWEGRRVTLQEVRGTLNGGTFALAAQLDRTGPGAAYEGQFQADRVALGPGMGVLGYLVPVLAGNPSGLEGRLDLNVYVRGVGTGRDGLRRALVGRGMVALDPVRLDGSPLVAELAEAVGTPARGRVGSVRSQFTIRGGRVSSDDLTLDLGSLPLVLSGWTDFDGRLDYRLRAERLSERLPDAARDLLSGLNLDPRAVTALEVRGTLDRLAVTVDGRPLRQVVGGPGAREQKLRELSRRLRDRVLR
jgi:AsmA protein